MFLNRLNALTESMRVRSSRIVNDLKRCYSVVNSGNSRSAYNVEISNVYSCTCSDFSKNGQKVVCKHIIFIFIKILNGSQFDQSLKDRFIGNEDLKELFYAAGRIVNPTYLEVKLKVSRKDFRSILANHEKFTQKQTWKAHTKAKRSAKCSGPRCRKVISIGNECLVVEGALTVPYNCKKAVEQKFYFCLNKSCTENPPTWTNISQILQENFTVENELHTESDRIINTLFT